MSKIGAYSIGAPAPSGAPLNLPGPKGAPGAHEGRKHSKWPASGAERWTECYGSVSLSEGIPDRPNKYSEAGTIAHEVLEALGRIELSGYDGAEIEENKSIVKKVTPEELKVISSVSQFMFDLHYKNPRSEFLIETRINLDFIHPEMFGTFDGAVIDHFGTLHIFDFKWGVSPVSPKRNLQLIYYALGLAHIHHFNFKNATLWIAQPRIPGYEGPLSWSITMTELLNYIPFFETAVRRTIERPTEFREGPWCHWCKAKDVCPLKRDARIGKLSNIFKPL